MLDLLSCAAVTLCSSRTSQKIGRERERERWSISKKNGLAGRGRIGDEMSIEWALHGATMGTERERERESSELSQHRTFYNASNLLPLYRTEINILAYSEEHVSL